MVVRGGWVGQQGWWQEVVVGGVKEVVGWGVNLVVVTRQLGGSSKLGQVGQELYFILGFNVESASHFERLGAFGWGVCRWGGG